ncbi:MAG: dipeptidase PepE [Chthoniobacterales bacterium]
MIDRRRVLLISSSTVFGRGYLDHAEPEIRDFLGSITRILFVPFALHDLDAYAAKTRARFAQMDYEIYSLHEAADMQSAIAQASTIFVGGGNTFRLLKALYDGELLAPIQQRVEAGMPYLGTSAGSNIAGPTIRTTNDMPIVEPPSFNSLGLVPFQINPHYLDPDPASTHMGETREERLLQFLEENDTPVIGLREGAILRGEHGEYEVRGTAGARLFRRGQPPLELAIGEKIPAPA